MFILIIQSLNHLIISENSYIVNHLALNFLIRKEKQETRRKRLFNMENIAIF